MALGPAPKGFELQKFGNKVFSRGQSDVENLSEIDDMLLYTLVEIYIERLAEHLPLGL